MRFSLRLPRISNLRRAQFPFRIRLPVLTAAEKTALLALALTLCGGGGLRLWERSGVRIGPVDDWESLRALIIRSRENDRTGDANPGGYPCRDEAHAYAFGGGRGEGSSGTTMLVTAGGAGATSGKPLPGGAGKKAPARAVDLNLAGEKALLTLPGIGPSTARAILAHRAAHGRFHAVDDLLKVKGIGPKKLDALRPYAKVAGAPDDATKRPVPARHENAARGEPPTSPGNPENPENRP